jgi:hypothetical protein
MSKKKSIVVPSVQGKQRKPKIQSETRCGCNVHIYVKFGSENKYYMCNSPQFRSPLLLIHVLD